jgi:hypothetical protein
VRAFADSVRAAMAQALGWPALMGWTNRDAFRKQTCE